MTDYFALLDEPRRPWLDPATLRQKFLLLSGTMHPDKIYAEAESEKDDAAKKFTTLNLAWNCLTDPKSRLLHLLELETGAKPKDIQQIPDDLADLFAEVATLCKCVDAFLQEKAHNPSPLLAVQSFERAQEQMGRLETLQNRLGTLRAHLDDGLKSLDRVWLKSETAERQELLPEMERLYRLFSYFNRWNNQLQERMVQLAL